MLNLDGLFLYPSLSDTLSTIDGTLLVHSGYWSGSKISFSLRFSDDSITEQKASIRVTTKGVFHPLISPSDGSIADMHSPTKAATPSELVPLVNSLHRLFNAPLAQIIGASEHVLNQTAAALFQEDKHAFARRVKCSLSQHTELDSSSPFRFNSVENWTPELQATLDGLVSPSAQLQTQDGFEIRFESQNEIQATE